MRLVHIVCRWGKALAFNTVQLTPLYQTAAAQALQQHYLILDQISRLAAQRTLAHPAAAHLSLLRPKVHSNYSLPITTTAPRSVTPQVHWKKLPQNNLEAHL